MKVKRTDALAKLQNAALGLASKETISQSNCFTFLNGKLMTFDGEVMTVQDSPFEDEVTGAIIANEFLKFIQRFSDEEIDVIQNAGQVKIKGKRKVAGLDMMEEILLPWDEVSEPGEMKKINPALAAAVKQAAQTCGTDDTAPKTTHVHIAKDRVEATDSFRVFRHTMKTGVKEAMMIRAEVISKTSRFTWVKMAADANWCHVESDTGMRISMLCCQEEYYPKKVLDQILSVEGDEIQFPEGMEEALSRAEITDTSEASIGQWDSRVRVSITDKGMEVYSKKEIGYYKELLPLEYDGPEMKFSIHPEILKEVIVKSRSAILNEEMFKIETKDTVFTAVLELI